VPLFHCIVVICSPHGDPDLVDLHTCRYKHLVPDLDLADPGMDLPALDHADEYDRGGRRYGRL